MKELIVEYGLQSVKRKGKQKYQLLKIVDIETRQTIPKSNRSSFSKNDSWIEFNFDLSKIILYHIYPKYNIFKYFGVCVINLELVPRNKDDNLQGEKFKYYINTNIFSINDIYDDDVPLYYETSNKEIVNNFHLNKYNLKVSILYIDKVSTGPFNEKNLFFTYKIPKVEIGSIYKANSQFDNYNPVSLKKSVKRTEKIIRDITDEFIMGFEESISQYEGSIIRYKDITITINAFRNIPRYKKYAWMMIEQGDDTNYFFGIIDYISNAFRIFTIFSKEIEKSIDKVFNNLSLNDTTIKLYLDDMTESVNLKK